MITPGHLCGMLPAAVLFMLAGVASTDSAAAVQVTDDAGRVVRLERPARRIISLAPHNTENLFSAGAGERIVGVVEFSDYPPKARSIPRIGGYYQLNMERIVALEPDLIVVWQSGNSSASLSRLEELGFTLFYSEPRSFDQILSNIRRLAELAGTGQSLAPRLERHVRRFSAIRERHAHKPRVRVYYQIWDAPMMTLNGEHLISELLETCGGYNVFHDLPVLAPQISVESVLQQDPEVIIIPGSENEKSHQREYWRKWTGIAAVRNDHIYFLDADQLNRHTVRVVDAAAGLCEILDRVRAGPRSGSE